MTTQEIIDALPHVGAGAIDEILFGIPEFAAKKINRQATEDWIKKNEKAYRTGEVLGTLGSLLIPVGGIASKLVKGGRTAANVARGARAADVGTDVIKLAKAADTGADVAKAAKKAADWGKISQLAKRGAWFGATESGVRGITSESEDIPSDIIRGGLFGAGGGVLGGLLAKNLGRYSGELKKKANQALIGRTPLRQFDTRRYLKEAAGPGAKGLGKFAKAEDALDVAADVVGKNKLYKIGADDVYFASRSDAWKKIDDVFEKAFPDVRGSQILEKAIDWDELAKIEKMPGGKEALDRVQNIIAQASDLQGLPNIRQYLSNIVKSTFKAPDENAAAAERAIANMLRRNVDDLVMETAEKAGLNINLSDLKKTYLADRMLGDAFARDIVAPTRINTGSPTMEKLIGATIGAGVGGATGEDLQTKARNMMLGGLIGFSGKRGAEALANIALSKGGRIADIAAKAAPKLGAKIPEATEAGGRIGGQLARALKSEELKPQNRQEAQAIDLGQEAGRAEASGDESVYRQKVDDRIGSFWAENGLEAQYPGQLAVFKAIIRQMTDDYRPEKTAAILFPDAERRKKYLAALDVSRKIAASLPGALEIPRSYNLPGQLVQSLAPEETKAKREASAAAIQGIIANALNANIKDPDYMKHSRQLYQRIIDAPGGLEEKRAMLKELLTTLGVDFEAIEEAGVIV